MTKPVISPVVLCGGSGTRLWPLSRKSFPKQFAPVIHDRSLLRLTLERLSALMQSGSLVCIGSEEHRFLISNELEAVNLSGKIILEPVAKNTAPAVALAAMAVGPDDLLLICPADHFIPDAQLFEECIRRAVPAAEQGAIVIFGVQPSFPSTAYGYIESEHELGEESAVPVKAFIEKPSLELATQLLANRNVFWNSGMVLAKAHVLLSELEVLAPDMLDHVTRAFQAGQVDGLFFRPDAEVFAQTPEDSFDYAVLEKSDKVMMTAFRGAWSDVGSWNALSAVQEADEDNNRLSGQAYAYGCSGTSIRAEHRVVVGLGLQDLQIVETSDAVLVARASEVEKIKHVVEDLRKSNVSQADMHRNVVRPWGSYDSIDSGDRFQVKRIVVKPGAALSLQKHYQRSEHWIVVKGTALVTRGEEQHLLSENESIYIPLGTTHRLENVGKTSLELIEVQTGAYLGEDDIVRLEDTYGRV